MAKAADALVAAVCSLALAGAAWGWRQRLLSAEKAPMVTEPWRHVRERFPVPAPFQEPPHASGPLLRAMVKANPFSPTRKPPPEPEKTDGKPAEAPKPPPVQFVYKGRVTMGSAQRAILLEATSGKTYFLQVGQDVAGFKVLDIDETRVLLSDLKTTEELTVTLPEAKKP